MPALRISDRWTELHLLGAGVSDPLAGQREAVNGGAESLLWPSIDAKGNRLPCPVKRGETFELRSCRITITKIHRLGRAQGWQWRAEFIRTKRVAADRVHLLAKRGGYTDDPRQALQAREQEGGWREVAENLGPPPEPEAVPPEVVADLPLSVAARERYEAEQAERRREWEALPLAERVRRLEARGDRVGRQLARIRAGIEAAERKLHRHGTPSDRAA